MRSLDGLLVLVVAVAVAPVSAQRAVHRSSMRRDMLWSENDTL